MKREIRAGTITGAAGVGAVIDVGTESFVIPGIDKWPQSSLRVLTLRRLSSRLRKILKTPTDQKPVLDVRRFPNAMFCEKCRRITFWRPDMEREGSEAVCPHSGCSGAMVPMRFIVACKNGHLDDFNWSRWAHTGPNAAAGCRSRERLTFKVNEDASTGGLASLVVRCEVCGSSRSLEEIASREAAKHVVGKCSCRHPWLYGPQGDCDATPEVLQRGATNLHYPVTISALDIPDDVSPNAAAEYAGQITAHSSYPRLRNLISDTQGANASFLQFVAETIAENVGCKVEIVLEVAQADIEGKTGEGEEKSGGDFDQNVLLDEEWKTISLALHNGGLSGENFRGFPEPLGKTAPTWARRLINGVLLLERLREVRAYQGFQRIKPGNPDVPPDVGIHANWLPATEVFGEGIVLSFDLDLLQQWRSVIPERELREIDCLEQKRLDENFWFLPKLAPEFLALHALSHLLIRRITFECGYSSSSLRERLYIRPEQGYAGLMIYTADGDSEGSLGGLVRQGKEDRLAQTLYEAAEQGHWCSADPVCSETAGQGLGGFNRASCHACLLVSETSCTCANTVLDRRLLLDEQWGLLPFLERQK